MIKLADLFPWILVSAVSALLATPLVVHLARRWSFFDVPGSAPHKIHEAPTPLGGGVVLLASFAVTMLVLGLEFDRVMFGVLAAGAVVVIWGLWDDYGDLPPLLKLLGQVLAVGIVIAGGLRVRLVADIWVNLALTVFWVVGLTNAFNFVDSMDGLALGLAGIGAAFFMLVTVDSQQPQLARLSAMVIGASIGFYYFNAAPAKIFLGDSGSQVLGLLLAAVGLAYNPVGLPQGVSWFTPVLVLGVAIFDAVLVVVTRIRDRRPLYRAGRDHTYHRLLSVGMDSTRAVLTMQIAAIVLGLIAFIALGATVVVANVIFTAIVLAGIAGVVLLLKRPSNSMRLPRE